MFDGVGRRDDGVSVPGGRELLALLLEQREAAAEAVADVLGRTRRHRGVQARVRIGRTLGDVLLRSRTVAVAVRVVVPVLLTMRVADRVLRAGPADQPGHLAGLGGLDQRAPSPLV